MQFINSNDYYKYNPDKMRNTFYQICSYKNENNMYYVRKFLFDENGIIKNHIIREYPKEKIEKFMKENVEIKYKIFPVSDFNLVSFPAVGDFVYILSDLMK